MPLLSFERANQWVPLDFMLKTDKMKLPLHEFSFVKATAPFLNHCVWKRHTCAGTPLFCLKYFSDNSKSCPRTFPYVRSTCCGQHYCTHNSCRKISIWLHSFVDSSMRSAKRKCRNGVYTVEIKMLFPSTTKCRVTGRQALFLLCPLSGFWCLCTDFPTP